MLESYKWNRTYVIHTKNMGLAAWPVPSLILADIFPTLDTVVTFRSSSSFNRA